jgi:hypothetical protein
MLGVLRAWEHLVAFRINSWVLQAKNCTARSRKVFHGGPGRSTMGRSQSFTCEAIYAHGTAIVATCPKCKCRSIFARSSVPAIDRCGFENHSFRCAWCASSLAGVIDPSDGELVLTLLDGPSDEAAIPSSNPLSGQHDLQCDTRVHGQDEQSSS